MQILSVIRNKSAILRIIYEQGLKINANYWNIKKALKKLTKQPPRLQNKTIEPRNLSYRALKFIEQLTSRMNISSKTKYIINYILYKLI